MMLKLDVVKRLRVIKDLEKIFVLRKKLARHTFAKCCLYRNLAAIVAIMANASTLLVLSNKVDASAWPDDTCRQVVVLTFLKW